MSLKENIDIPESFSNLINGSIGLVLRFEVLKQGISEFNLFALDIESNRSIAAYRASLGMPTPNNRIDKGDLKMVISSLAKLGFEVVTRIPIRPTHRVPLCPQEQPRWVRIYGWTDAGAVLLETIVSTEATIEEDIIKAVNRSSYVEILY